MMKGSVQPYTGPHVIDLTEVASLLVDLAQGSLRGVRREQPGIDGVVSELQASVPALGYKAAISPDVYENFLSHHALILKIRAALTVVAKAAEVLTESAAYYEDQREIDISLMAAAVRTSARRKDESISAAFEKTLIYYAQFAMKGVKTRRKNAEAKRKGEPTAETGPEDANAEEPALKAKEPASKAEMPTKAKKPKPKVEEPALKAEEPASKAEEPASKAEELAKTKKPEPEAEEPTDGFLLPTAIQEPAAPSGPIERSPAA